MDERDQELSEIYRQAEHPSPSPALDARIADAARKAVAKGPSHRRSPWLRWVMPLSTTAVLVLAVSMLLKMEREGTDLVSNPMSTPAERSLETPQAPIVLNEQKQNESDQLRRPSVIAQADIPATSHPPVSEQPTVAAPEPQAFPAQSGARPEAMAKVETLARLADRGGAGQPAYSFSGADETRDASPLGRAKSAEGFAAGNLAASEAKNKEAEEQRPEEMVARIRKLIQEGKREEARKLLGELKKNHPEYRLPDDLKRID